MALQVKDKDCGIAFVHVPWTIKICHVMWIASHKTEEQDLVFLNDLAPMNMFVVVLVDT